MKRLDRLARLVCQVTRCHAWRHVTDHQEFVLVYCRRCGAFPVWYARP